MSRGFSARARVRPGPLLPCDVDDPVVQRDTIDHLGARRLASHVGAGLGADELAPLGGLPEGVLFGALALSREPERDHVLARALAQAAAPEHRAAAPGVRDAPL